MNLLENLKRYGVKNLHLFETQNLEQLIMNFKPKKKGGKIILRSTNGSLTSNDTDVNNQQELFDNDQDQPGIHVGDVKFTKNDYSTTYKGLTVTYQSETGPKSKEIVDQYTCTQFLKENPDQIHVLVI